MEVTIEQMELSIEFIELSMESMHIEFFNIIDYENKKTISQRKNLI